MQNSSRLSDDDTLVSPSSGFTSPTTSSPVTPASSPSSVSSSRSLYPTPRFPSTFPQVRAWATFGTAPPDVLDYLEYGGGDGGYDDDDDDGGIIAPTLPCESVRLVQPKKDRQLTGSPLAEERETLFTTNPYFEFGYPHYTDNTTAPYHIQVFPMQNHSYSPHNSILAEHGHGHPITNTHIDHSPPNICIPPKKAHAQIMDSTHLNVSLNNPHQRQSTNDDSDVEVSSLSALCGLGVGIESLIRSVSVWPRARISSFFANKTLTEEELDIELECDLFGNGIWPTTYFSIVIM